MITYRFRRSDNAMLESPKDGETFYLFQYLKNGLKCRESYFKDSCLHREDGPAERILIKGDPDDEECPRTIFCLRGYELSFETWLSRVTLDDETRNRLMKEYSE